MGKQPRGHCPLVHHGSFSTTSSFHPVKRVTSMPFLINPYQFHLPQLYLTALSWFPLHNIYEINMREGGEKMENMLWSAGRSSGTAFKRSEMKLCSELGSLILNFTHIFTQWLPDSLSKDWIWFWEFRESVICHHRAHDLVGEDKDMNK